MIPTDCRHNTFPKILFKRCIKDYQVPEVLVLLVLEKLLAQIGNNLMPLPVELLRCKQQEQG
jgi:hypothetical protein